jgi:hypothetical protein
MVLEGMAKDKVTTKVLSTYLLLYLQTHARLQPNQQVSCMFNGSNMV